MIKSGWIPPRSPWSLIQEDIWPAEWKILVVCVMLNCTTRKQVEKVIPEFFERWPTPASFTNANKDDIKELIRPLGFANRRTNNLQKMTRHYLSAPWENVRELPGIGDYAARAHEIFCQGILGDTAPKDGSLARYWQWCYTRQKKSI